MTTIGELPTVVARGEPPAPPAAAAAPPPQVPAPRAPVTVLDLHVQPSIAGGRRRGRFVAVVTNPSSVALQVQLSVTGDDGATRGLVAPCAFELAPGAQRAAGVELRARRPRLLGRELERRATIEARGRDGAQVARRTLVFVQSRLLPFWCVLLATAVAAGAAFASTLLPARATVPRVEGAADVAAAQRLLGAAGLAVDPRVRSRTVATAAPGTVLDQIPAPGTRAGRGDRVALLVAVGPRRAVVPDVEGVALGRALALVRAAGLSAGTVLPAGAPAGAIVAGQLPVAGRRVAAGTVATLFAGAAGTAAAASRALQGPAPASGARATVPPRDGERAAAYARAVAAAGLTPKIVRAVSPAPLGTLVAVRPAPGTALAPRAAVRLVVAAGVPRLAFDTGAGALR